MRDVLFIGGDQDGRLRTMYTDIETIQIARKQSVLCNIHDVSINQKIELETYHLHKLQCNDSVFEFFVVASMGPVSAIGRLFSKYAERRKV